MSVKIKNPGRNRRLAIIRQESETAVMVLRVMAHLIHTGYTVKINILGRERGGSSGENMSEVIATDKDGNEFQAIDWSVGQCFSSLVYRAMYPVPGLAAWLDNRSLQDKEN